MTSTAPPAPTVGYLGPIGTFTEQALLSQPDLVDFELVRFPSIIEVLRAAEAGTIDFGFAAIENMIEGSVNTTIDTLAFDASLLIQREVVLNVSLNLLVNPGVTLDDIGQVMSHPMGYAQCRRFLADVLPGASIEATNSTADAARLLAESGDTTVAAIAPQRAAEVYDLEILQANIEDEPDNQTRFVLVGRHGVPKPTGHDKTSVLVFQRQDAPGSLVGILQEFAARSINLTKLESRPTKNGLGDYCFLIDCEGHIDDEVVADALRNLHMKTSNIKFLGSYPSAYGTAEVQADNRDAVHAADTWVNDLRNQVGR